MEILIYIAIFASHLLYACIWIDPMFYKKAVERYNYDSVNVLATIDNFPAVVMEGKHLGLSFHPELDGITIFHEILFNPSCKFHWSNLNKVNAA